MCIYICIYTYTYIYICIYIYIYIYPIVIGALGSNPKSLEKHFNELNVEVNTSQMQTTLLLNSGRIIRKVLEF